MSLTVEINRHDIQNNLDIDSSFEVLPQVYPDWSELPPLVLEIIYTYLKEVDQVNMALVCKKWAMEYASPGVWKNFTYNLFSRSESEKWPDLKVAEKFGCMFRHVEISGYLFIRERIDKANEQLQLFFEALTASNCQLLSLTVKNLYRLSQFLNEEEFKNLLNCKIQFIRTQRCLRTVKFSRSYYRREDAVLVFSAICQSSSKTLKTLDLKGFSRDRFQLENILSLFENLPMPNFCNLQTLRVDYSQFFEDYIQLLFCQKNVPNSSIKTLSLIDMFCEGSKSASIIGVSPMIWKYLRKSCPDLRIQMNIIYTSQIRNDFSTYLTDYIPLKHLECRVEKTLNNPNSNISDFLQQICSCRGVDFLEYLSIVWMSAVDDISICLLPFLQVSKKLRTLQMILRYPVTGVENLLYSLLRNRPESLEYIHISLTRVDNEADLWNLLALADEYSPLFQVIGINVILLADSE